MNLKVMIIGYFVITFLLVSAFIACSVQIASYVNKKGLKNIVHDVWEGTGK